MTTTKNYNYVEARDLITIENKSFTRPSWCKVIRPAEETDREQINYEPAGLIVEDCSRRECDCEVAIWQPTKEDHLATDYVEVTK